MSFFEFAVRRLRWLARVPLAPQIFDGMLLAWTALADRERMRAMEAIEAAAVQLPGVKLSLHRFGGIGFSVRGKELGHLHGNGLLDILAGRELAMALVAERRAQPHHVFGPSAWISYWVRSAEDVPGAIELLRRSLGGS